MGESRSDDDDTNSYKTRSRDPSIDGRDEFANRRAQSEPPVTWHKYLGIKWYQQFEEIHQFHVNQELNAKFKDLNINHDDSMTDDEDEDDDEMKINGNNYNNNGQRLIDHYDPNHMFQEEEDDEDDDDIDDDDES